MKFYDNTMAQLRFREDFCGETILKAQQSRRRFPKSLAAAACMCLCCVALFTTAWAVSAEFRSIFIQSEASDQTETVTLPQKADAVIESTFGTVRARYYKLDGKMAATAGFGSLLPVEKDGVVTYYAVQDGELCAAEPIQKIQKTLEYNGETFELDMDIYDGEVATAVLKDYCEPMADINSYTIWYKTQENLHVPLTVDLTTWEIHDPMANVEFSVPEGIEYAHVSDYGDKVLIRCYCDVGVETLYCADTASGEIAELESEHKEWFGCAGEIYCHDGKTLSRLKADLTLETVVEECDYTHPTGYASFCEGANMTIFDLENKTRFDIENGAELFRKASYIHHSADRSKLGIANFAPGNGLNTKAIAIVDLEGAQMYSLERKSGMKEEMCGWFGNDSFLIAGTVGDEWYVCMYEIG